MPALAINAAKSRQPADGSAGLLDRFTGKRTA